MFLVVYLPRFAEHIVIPEKWLFDHKKQTEKFLNYGINANQLHVCFWTNDPSARDQNGMILENFEPNFNASFKCTFPSDGCYLCQVVKAKGMFLLNFGFMSTTNRILINSANVFIHISAEFSKAREYERSLRSRPALYNENRLFQRPKPRTPSAAQLNQADRELLINLRGKNEFFFRFYWCICPYT